ncbi:MAG: AAA family ATPase [Pseudomonadales bacterium]|nr:AAA family ATPase [Pseudomonadales bacterium]
MRKILVFGNSGSGKSTLAKELKHSENLAHLDLDELAWQQSNPPQRAPLENSLSAINEFAQKNDSWVIEGCYSDLLELAVEQANEIIYLNLPVHECISNARNRPWEAHKYESKEAQDENLEMLLSWIEDYDTRTDVFSKASHQKLYNCFTGKKTMVTTNARDT